MKIRHNGFTLIELLVVVAIIALLIAILLPSLSKARGIARAVKCGAQLHSVGQAVAGYNAENDNIFPASYLYPDASNQVNAYTQPPSHPYGYQHWSYYLFNQVKDLTAFTCPEFERGGVPRTNPGPDPRNWMSGQVDQNGGTTGSPTSITDNQAPFMAFTANAAILPRNKFTPAIATAEADGSNGLRLNMYVKRTTLDTAESATILMTEFNTNWKTIAEQQGGGQFLAKGHRPLNPFYNLGSGTNEFQSTPNQFFTMFRLPRSTTSTH